MVEIAPSILSADFANLEQHCRKVVTPDNRWLHFDVMDGVFVPNLSVGIPVLQCLAKALPEAYYDVHLMIVDPQKYIEQFHKAGADSITIHYEADSPVKETLQAIRDMGCKAGLSIKPKTPVEEIFPLLPLCDLVLVMSVEPGFGGQAFIPESAQRISDIRKEASAQNLSLLIEVDGGINNETAAICIKAGADVLVAGSSIFGAEDPAAVVKTFKSMA